MVSRYLAVMAMGGLLLLADDAQAAAVSGQIHARLVITASCEVSKGSESAPVSPTGGTALLDFGSQGPTWNNTLGAGISDGDKAPLAVSCNPSVSSFTVTIDGGTNGDGTTRRLSNGRQTIPYRLSADPQGRSSYSIGQQRNFVVAKGTQIPIPVFGSVVANTSALPAGIYTDTLTVTLDW
ncbi:spore coat protein U domain-containing protein [Pseudomonas tolaasii]|uniref:Spore coat protein U domain-containing protein n=2 Tax=Pseudomonas tolaasii TaxID=29442 RepID=A0A7Y8DP56_PSETO|nr:spore coat protein U domain-containing protein [Pseudomonas tolaasii]ARB29814.1 spore coat protein [Pseudomonas tolaasii]KAB0478305.1 spore coat protein U domain-containing protein [Pseudomonas tolaasii]MBW1246596.1 spore coat protein U domain-containing protein [Pseudomonas tolaasii]MBW4793429.1 spore coat protein U domain-containing protein [Pseudomonas tolaasii]MBY8942823.1 spore coat protein U domain-containing protein [Pseudomonas tolaasii]